MRSKKVLLLGSYGQGNLGDDLLMWNYLELLRSKGFQEIYVSANTTEFIPQPIKEAYPNLHVISTYKTSVVEYVKLIRKVDCIVYGGGTLYKELYSSTGRSKYGVIVRMMVFNMLARLLGTRLYHLHIGIGSLKTGTGRLITILALRAATFTLFRDQTSYNIAKNSLHIPKKKIETSVDGLFMNHIWEGPWHTSKLKISRKKYQRIVGVSVLSDIPDWVDRDHYISTIKQFITGLLDQGDYVIFMPFQHAFNPRSDLAFMKETFADVLEGRSNYTLLKRVPIDLVSSYMQQCDLFVGMRFHSLLLATANRVPFVAIAYDTKCWRFVQEMQYPYAVELEKLQLDDLNELYRRAVAAKAATRRQLNTDAKRLYKQAEEGLRTLNL